MSEIYFSTDVETDGPIPGLNSMLSLGSAAYTGEGKLLGTFEVNLHTLEGATADADTMAWWSRQQKAWKACRENPIAPEDAMSQFVKWVKSYHGSPVFVAYPAGFDFLFVYWYLIRFAGESPFSHSALDMKTFAMSLMGTEYRQSTKRNMPRRWFESRPHTHRALDDALEQGALFCKMLAEWRERSPARGKE